MKKNMTFGLLLAAVFVLSAVMPFAVRDVAAGDGVVNRYAVIVGISDYKAISDLSYCDEDANDWFNQLDPRYDCVVLGDHTSNYVQYDGVATEYAVKQAIANMVAIADEDDIIVFASSGHGGATRGKVRNSFLCMWDCGSGENGENGYLYDYEMAPLFQNAVCKWFIFLDHCNSGGMDEVMGYPNKVNGFMTTTCTALGYGYDYTPGLNGAWTYFFLEIAWQQYYGGSFTVSMETVFDHALSIYPYANKDLPQKFDGNTAVAFYL